MHLYQAYDLPVADQDLQDLREGHTAHHGAGGLGFEAGWTRSSPE